MVFLLLAFSLKNMISIEQIRPEHTWLLRRDLLYPAMMKHEMEMPEDVDGIHFGAFRDNKLVGVVSLFQTGTDFQFRKLAVEAGMQHAGIGSALVNYVIAWSEKNGGTRIWCNARLEATGFYLKLGFSQTGNLFTRKGIDYELVEKAITPVSNHIK